MLTTQCMVGLAGALLSLAVVAGPLEISGVKVDDPITLSGATLVLNGVGIRYKAVFQVYVATLYTRVKANTPEGVYGAPGPKRLSITLLRDVDSSEIGKTFAKAVESPVFKGEMARLVPSLTKIERSFADHGKLLAGENFTIDWLPGTGTVLTVKGVQQGETFNEVEVFNALLGIWLGPNAADWHLRDALLGKGAL